MELSVRFLNFRTRTVGRNQIATVYASDYEHPETERPYTHSYNAPWFHSADYDMDDPRWESTNVVDHAL